MSRAVMLSVRPAWCELIASGKKTIEVRKTRPKLATPFKCYIYCTTNDLLTKSHQTGKIYVASNKKYQETLERNGNITYSGKVIGEFVCDEILDIRIECSDPNMKGLPMPKMGMTDREIMDYLGNGKPGYGWHISALQIYDRPKELREFARKPCDFPASCRLCSHSGEEKPKLHGLGFGCDLFLTRPPQSWGYVEEIE